MDNLTWHQGNVSRKDRENLLNQKGAIVWITGLSGSGKSTIANICAERLNSIGNLTYVLDGDNIRQGLNSDLGFSKEDRFENIRRVTEVAKLMADCGIITFVAFIAPYAYQRNELRDEVENYIEVYAKCPLEELERRDPKGLYKKAKAGEIKEFTGISAPYEEPDDPDIVLDTLDDFADSNAEAIIDHLSKKNII